ncbi:MAG: hypothetical protein WCH11_00985 [Bdellovibrio sp.]
MKLVVMSLVTVFGLEVVWAAANKAEPKRVERRETERDSKTAVSPKVEEIATKMEFIASTFSKVDRSLIQTGVLKVTDDGVSKSLSASELLKVAAKRMAEAANADRAKAFSKTGMDGYYLHRIVEMGVGLNLAARNSPGAISVNKLAAISGEMLGTKNADGSYKYADANFKSLVEVIKKLVDKADASGSKFEVDTAVEQAVGSKEKLKELEECTRA